MTVSFSFFIQTFNYESGIEIAIIIYNYFLEIV